MTVPEGLFGLLELLEEKMGIVHGRNHSFKETEVVMMMITMMRLLLLLLLHKQTAQ